MRLEVMPIKDRTKPIARIVRMAKGPHNADFFIKKIKIRITRKIKECGVARNGVKELANYLM